MPTFGALKARIVLQIGGRTDLTSEIASAIADAIEHYSDKRFYWLAEDYETATAAGDPVLALPENYRSLKMVTVTVAGQRRDLPPDRNQITYDEFRARSYSTVAQGQPLDYAIWNEAFYFDPVPDAAYPVTISYYGPVVGVPAADGDSNAWTVAGEQLIRAKAKALLFRDAIRNFDQAQLQEGVAAEQVAKLLGRSSAQDALYRAMPKRF